MPVGHEYQNRNGDISSRFGFSFMQQSDYRQSQLYNSENMYHHPLEEFHTDALRRQFSPIANIAAAAGVHQTNELFQGQDLSQTAHESSTDSTKSPDYSLPVEKRSRMRINGKSQEITINDENGALSLTTNSASNNSMDSSDFTAEENSKKASEKGLSRASYMCRKCKAHGVSIAVKQHKKDCQFSNCKCVKCQLVEKGRQVVARQIALYRDQKATNDGKSAKNSKQMLSLNELGYSSLEREHADSRVPISLSKSSNWQNPLFSSSGNELQNELESMLQSRGGDISTTSSLEANMNSAQNSPANQSMALALFQRTPHIAASSVSTANLGGGATAPSTPSNDSESGNSSSRVQEGPHCRRCRNHNVAVTWRGHKKNCPYRQCTCGPCKLINERKDTEKTLRDMLGFEEEKTSGFNGSDNRQSATELDKLGKVSYGSNYFRNEAKNMRFQSDMLLNPVDGPFNLSISSKHKDKSFNYALPSSNTNTCSSNKSSSDLDLEIENAEMNFYANNANSSSSPLTVGSDSINKFSSFWQQKYTQNISNRMMSIPSIPEELCEGGLLPEKYPLELTGYGQSNGGSGSVNTQQALASNNSNNSLQNNSSNYFQNLNAPTGPGGFYEGEEFNAIGHGVLANGGSHCSTTGISPVHGGGQAASGQLCCHDNVSAVAMAAAAATAAMVAMQPAKNCHYHHYYHHYYHHHHEHNHQHNSTHMHEHVHASYHQHLHEHRHQHLHLPSQTTAPPHHTGSSSTPVHADDQEHGEQRLAITEGSVEDTTDYEKPQMPTVQHPTSFRKDKLSKNKQLKKDTTDNFPMPSQSNECELQLTWSPRPTDRYENTDDPQMFKASHKPDFDQENSEAHQNTYPNNSSSSYPHFPMYSSQDNGEELDQTTNNGIHFLHNSSEAPIDSDDCFDRGNKLMYQVAPRNPMSY